jgi:O-antigen ligase
LPRNTAALKHADTFTNKLTYYCFLALIISVPLAFTTYVENSFDLVKDTVLKLLGGIFIISSMASVYRKSGGIDFNKNIDPYVLFFLAAAMLSTIFSLNPNVSYSGGYIRQVGFVTYLYLILIYVFAGIILKDKDKFQNVLRVMELTGVIVALYAIIQFVGIDPLKIQSPGNPRPTSTIGHSIFTAGFLLMVFPFSFLRLYRKILTPGTLIPIIIIAAVIITQTRTAYAAIFAEIIFLVVAYALVSGGKAKFKKLIKTSLPIVLILIAVLLLFIFFAPDNIYVMRLVSIFGITNNPRWLLWRDSFEIFKQHPLTGTGIANFSNPFEDIYTHEFRMMDVKGIYDNAHNNFVNILCTMGLAGLAAYMVLLFRSVYLGFKSLFSSELDGRRKFFFLGFLSVIFGYIVYSLADFDDISILLYLYVYLAMLKVQCAGKESGILTLRILSKPLRLILPVLVSLYLIYNMYHSLILFKADNYFKQSHQLFAAGDNHSAFTNFTKASDLNPACPEYRYEGGFILLNEAINDTTLSEQQKTSLLADAEKQLLMAKEVHPSSKLCQAALCLVLFEMGRKEEAEKIKNELFLRDSLSMDLRTNLARYYMRADQYDKAKEQVDVLSRYDPDNVEANITLVYYYFRTGDYEKAKMFFRHAQQKAPNNLIVRQFAPFFK